MSHVCRRCGASCQGLKVHLEPHERAPIAAHAEALGVERPFSGPYLRQNWGTCVFYDQGCRLHAQFGAGAKPSTCRRFPEAEGLDPSCFHPGEQLSAPPTEDWKDLSHGLRTRDKLRALPLGAVLRPARLGSLTVDTLTGLEHAEPQAPGPLRGRLEWHSRVAESVLTQHASVRSLLVGGGQLLTGLERPAAYAAWVRLLRVLPTL